MKSKSREHKPKAGSRVRHTGGKDELKNMSSFVGAHAKTHVDQRSFIGSMMHVQRRDSRDPDGKYKELKRMLQKTSNIIDYHEKHHHLPKSKIYGHLKQPKLISMTQYSNLDKSHHIHSGSKEVLYKLKHLFATRSTEKAKTKLRNSKDKKTNGRSIDDLRPSRGYSFKNKSRDPSKASRSSAESKASRDKEDISYNKLTKFYEKLCKVVDAQSTSHDEKITSISKLFIEYAKLTEKLDDDRPGQWSNGERKLRQKILSFFTFYSSMNAKAYVYTRKLVSDSLAHVEKLIVKERVALQQFTPQYFAAMESVDLEEAVHMLVDFAQTVAEQNDMLAGYIRKNVSKVEMEDLMLKSKKPAIVKSLMPKRRREVDGRGHTDSSISNLEKENDINQLYDRCNPYLDDDEYEVRVDAKIQRISSDEKNNDIEFSESPLTNKQGYYHTPDADYNDDYEYSETSKKKPMNPLGRKKSRATNVPSKNSRTKSKDKKTFPLPNRTKDTWPKKSMDSTHKYDEQSFSNLTDDGEIYQNRHQIPAIDLRLRLGQIKKDYGG